MAAARCHIAFLPSLWPETFMYTLSAVMASGLYTICFDLGAQASRLQRWGWGQVLPLDTAPAAINEALLAAAQIAGGRLARALPSTAGPLSRHPRFVLRLLARGTSQILSPTGHGRRSSAGETALHAKGETCTFSLASPRITCPRRPRWPTRSSASIPRRCFTSSSATRCRSARLRPRRHSIASSMSATCPLRTSDRGSSSTGWSSSARP